MATSTITYHDPPKYERIIMSRTYIDDWEETMLAAAHRVQCQHPGCGYQTTFAFMDGGRCPSCEKPGWWREV